MPYPVEGGYEGEYQADDPQAGANPADDERGGPTIFDRRGSGQAAPNAYLEDYPRPRRTQPETESAPPVEPAQSQSRNSRRPCWFSRMVIRRKFRTTP